MPHLNAESLTSDPDGLEFLHNVLHEGGAPAVPTVAALNLRAAAILQTSLPDLCRPAERTDLSVLAEQRGVVLSLA